MSETMNSVPVMESNQSSLITGESISVNLDQHVTEPFGSSSQSPLSANDQLIEVTVSLIGILLLIYGLAWLLKRQKHLNPAGKLKMKTLAVLPMGVKEKIVLVQVGPKQLLLGMTPQNINTLAQFDEPIMTEEASGDTMSFASRLKSMMEAGRATKEQPSESRLEAASEKHD